jgi:hypothetical protein
MSKSRYNFIARFIHRLALQSKAVAEISFDIENVITKNKNSAFEDKHVFISGLARSGTTILMQYLYETGCFKSLTYRDMPFVLMPNTWKKISHRKTLTGYKERAHLDGIMIGHDSPEAFEEVFWRLFCGKDCILYNRLRLHAVDDETIEKFRRYILNVLFSGDRENQTRYLSKNNNNVLRLQYLHKAFPKSQIIIPFRDPLQQSISLLDQHMHFFKIQAEDKFSLNYMNWLGHFEFGLNQKSFYLNDEDTFAQMQRYDKTDINFWLLNWKNYYQYVYEHHTPNTIFFNYDKFCQNPSSELSALFVKLDINTPAISIKPFEPRVRSIDDFDQGIMEDCNWIYKQLATNTML